MFNMVCCADLCKLCRRTLHRFMDCRIPYSPCTPWYYYIIHVALLLMVLPAAPWRSWWSVVRIMRSACAAVYKIFWHRFTLSPQRKDYLFFFKIPWASWAGKASRSSRIFFSKTPKKKLLHKSHQLLRNSIFVSQKLLCKILTVNSSLYRQQDWCMYP